MTEPVPTPPQPDLRALAAQTMRQVELSWPPSDVLPYEVFADAVLAAVLPAHRQQVLTEAADAVEATCDCAGNVDPAIAGQCEYRQAAAFVRRLAAAAPTDSPILRRLGIPPADRPSATLPAQDGPAVPGQAAEADPRPASMLRRVDDLLCECRPDGRCEHNGEPAAVPGTGDNPQPGRPNDERLRIDLATAIVRAGVDCGTAIVRAGVDFGDDNSTDLFEWHECIDQPNCSTVRDGQPCACAGIPYLSDEVWAEVGPVLADHIRLARLIEQLTAGRATWKAKAEEMEAERDRLACERDGVRDELARMAGDLEDARLDRDRLAGIVRRYEPVIEAAKVLAAAAWNSTAPRTPIFQALLAAVAALSDAGRAQDEEPTLTRAIVARATGGRMADDTLAEQLARAVAEADGEGRVFTANKPGDEWVRYQYREAARRHLRALGGMGRLVPDGATVETEWGTRRHGNPHLGTETEVWASANRTCAENVVKMRITAPTDLLRRTVITGTWEPVPATPEETTDATP